MHAFALVTKHERPQSRLHHLAEAAAVAAVAPRGDTIAQWHDLGRRYERGRARYADEGG